MIKIILYNDHYTNYIMTIGFFVLFIIIMDIDNNNFILLLLLLCEDEEKTKKFDITNKHEKQLSVIKCN